MRGVAALLLIAVGAVEVSIEGERGGVGEGEERGREGRLAKQFGWSLLGFIVQDRRGRW
jgi:hypothetical protein